MNNNQENYETVENVEAVEMENDFSPLDAPVKQRSYTQHKFDEAHTTFQELEEPSFEAPSFSDFEEQAEESSEPERVFNESYSELDGKEKKMGAKMMAEMTLDLYEKGCGFLGKLPEISEAKLDEMIAEGEIDPNIQLQTESGAVPVKEFASEYNSSIKEAFGVSEEFKEKVKPPLIRVFEKRGIGMTDEQLLMYYFATDIGAKGVQAFMLKKTANNIIQSLKDNTLALKESQRPAPTPTPTPQASAPVADYKEEKNDSDYTDDISQVVKEQKPRRKKPATVMDMQVEHFAEPEEDGVYSVLNDRGGFAFKEEADPSLPKFGDVEILAGLEEIGKQSGKPTRKKATTKSTNRKPRKK